MLPDWLQTAIVASIPICGLLMIVRPQWGGGSNAGNPRSARNWGALFVVIGTILLVTHLIPG